MARSGRTAWWCAKAQGALRRALGAGGVLTPAEVAATVTGALPARLRRRLRRQLWRLGWMTPAARVPLDALDEPRRPAGLRGVAAPLLELAVFGLPGQGMAARDRRRQDVYQQLAAEIMREAVDSVSLQAVARRALNHPEVVADAQLMGMVRSFIAEREAALVRPPPAEAEHRAQQHASKLRHAFDAPAPRDFPTRAEALAQFARRLSEFEAALTHFDEHSAQQALTALRDLRARFPVHISAESLQRSEEQYDRFLRRIATYRRQLRELADQGAAAAQAGDAKTAAWILRRFDAIRTLVPGLVPEIMLAELRARITNSEEQSETRELRRELLSRERAVADEIKQLAAAIRQYEQVVRQAPADSDERQRAEAAYRAAVERVRALDSDWLAGLILQLETLLDDLRDPTGEIHNQLEQFIVRVRAALNRLRVEVRSIQAGRRGGGAGESA